MKTLKCIAVIVLTQQVACTDLGTDIQWSQWQRVECVGISFYVPPHTYLEYFPEDAPPELVFYGATYPDRIPITVWLYSAADLHAHLGEFIDGTYQVEVDNSIATDGRVCRLVRYVSQSNEYSRVLSLYFMKSGNNPNELLLWVRIPDPTKDYIGNQLISSIQFK
jgi:hypothetical protein